MRRYRFRLEPVLRVRRQEQDTARAAVLAALGVPLLGWLTLVHGPVVGGLALAGGASVLRWPLIHLTRRLRGRGARHG